MSADHTSLQPLGDARVLVEFEVEQVNGKPNVTVNGCFVNGEFVEASCFSEGQLVAWESDVLLELLEVV